MPDTVEIPRPLIRAILLELDRSAEVLGKAEGEPLPSDWHRPLLLTRTTNELGNIELYSEDVRKLTRTCLSTIRRLHGKLRKSLETSTSVLESLEKEKKRIDNVLAYDEDTVNMDLLTLNTADNRRAGIEELSSTRSDEDDDEIGGMSVEQ